MQPLRTKFFFFTTLWDKKKITKNLGTINHTNSWEEEKKKQRLDKKYHPTSQNKKKYATSRDKKYATSWDKKIHNLPGQKIMQPLRSKKSRNLLGQRNHATSKDNIITL